jgi:MoaA/NifB/PqqE/SkfB family radical SAM enzyme
MYYRTVFRLLGQIFAFRYHKILARPLKPTAVSLSLTQRCNSHCIMCNIWRRSQEELDLKKLELSSQEIRELLSQPLFSELVELDLTGGEPHLRDDLVDIVVGIASLKSTHLHRLRSIIVTSNGLLSACIVSNYQRILETIKGAEIDLVCVISLDGFGETHDRVRGTPGAYQRVSKTIGNLLELRAARPHFYIGIKTTILPQNVDALNAILDFALTNDLFPIISPVFFTAGRFRNLSQEDSLSLDPEEDKKLFQFYSRKELRTSYFYSRALNHFGNGRKTWRCTAGYSYLFIEFDGKVYPCEMMDTPMGDLRKQDAAALLSSRLFRDWRQKMEKLPACRACLEPGAIRYSALTEGSSYLGFVRQLGKYESQKTIQEEGFSKYL